MRPETRLPFRLDLNSRAARLRGIGAFRFQLANLARFCADKTHHAPARGTLTSTLHEGEGKRPLH